MFVSAAPVTWFLVPLQRPQAAALRLYSPSVKSAGPFLLLPGAWRRDTGPAWGGARLQPRPVAAAARFPSAFGPAVGEAAPRPCSPLPSSVAPARPPVRPGAQAGRVDAGFGGRLGSRGVARGGPEICPTPGSRALPAEAGSDCSPGGKTNPVCSGQGTVAGRCSHA